MIRLLITLRILFVVLIFTTSCKKNNTAPPPTPPTGIIKTNLIKIEDALKNSDPNFVNLLNMVRGSVGTNGPGSKVIWSKKNDYKLGLFVSANHVYGINTWLSPSEEFISITEINNGIFLGSRIPSINGNVNLSNELIANFGIYHPLIPLNTTNTSIYPRDDFYLGVIDNQRIIDNGLGNYPKLVQTTIPLQMYDPNNRTQVLQTWADVQADENVVALGYPQDKLKYPNGAVSSGKVCTDKEAENIIESLRLKNDAEGQIPYDSKVEFIAKIHAIPGMSGGGVFSVDGQLLGVMVRATELNGEPILRVVRMKFIKQKISSFYNTLSASDKNKLRPFISGELN